MKIEEILPDGYLENKTIEYKVIIEEGKSKEGKNLEIGWLKTLVAFANTDGGTMVIGVEDRSHKIVALEPKQADKIILMIHRQVRQRIEPIIDYSVESIVVKGKEMRYVLLVKVSANRNLPVVLHEEGLLGIYVRNFGQTNLANQEQIRDLVLMRDNTPFDIQLTDLQYHEDKFTYLKNLMAKNGDSFSKKEFFFKHIISEEEKLTRGATLFLDDCDDLRTKIIATKWLGCSKGSMVVEASEEYTGNLLVGIEKSLAFIKNHSSNGFVKYEDGRKDYISYPARSVLEGIVNAVGHRNYYIQGSQIEINIFKDRLEITSPGTLLGVRELHREENISSIIPRRRNDIICDILAMCRYMEEKGSGFDRIEEDYSLYDEKFKPFFSADSSSFTLTLPDVTYIGVVSDMTDSPMVYVTEALPGKNDLKILSYCFNKARTVKEIADYIGVTPSTYFRKNVIARLIESSMLLKRGGDGKEQYISNPDKVIL